MSRWLQEREADTVEAAIIFATRYVSRRALGLFDKLVDLEERQDALAPDSNNDARTRKQTVAGVIEELHQLQVRRVP